MKGGSDAGSGRIFTRAKKDKPDNLIIMLSSANKTSSHHVANDVFCRWYDLDRYKEDFRFLTVLDSTSRAFRDGGHGPRRQRVAGHLVSGGSEELRAMVSRGGEIVRVKSTTRE